MVKQLKEHAAALQDVLQTLKKRKSERSTTPTPQIQKIDVPDVEFRISLRIVNDLIQQNLPFNTTVNIDDSNKVEITVTSAMVLTGPENALHVKINAAEIRFKRGKIDFGVKSKDFELTISPGISKSVDKEINLVVYGHVSKFNIKYFPGIMDSAIKEILNLVMPFPLLDVNLKDYLDVNRELSNDVVLLKIRKELESASLIVDGGSIHIKVKYTSV